MNWMRRPFTGLIASIAALGIAGCAAGGGSTNAISLPELPSLTTENANLPPATISPPGTATELYAKIARGALGCWFAPRGPLKKDYIYHADADAPSRGGKSEITIHRRDATQPNPRGARVFRVKIDPTSATAANITSENLRLTAEQAAGLTSDVNRWAKGEQGCGAETAAADWSARVPAASSADTAVTQPAALSP
jgi:hypothetical protein